MIQIIESNKKKSTKDKWGEAFANIGQALPDLINQYQNNQKNEKKEEATRKLGIDPDLPPEIQKLMMQYNLMGGLEEKKGKNEKDLLNEEYNLKQKAATSKLKGEKQEKIKTFENALGTIQEMRRLGATNNLGRSLTGGLFGGQMAKDRGKYEQLGKSLISFASTIPIRNKAEFETLAENLYDPSIPDSKREGILSGMEDIIRKNMSVYMDEAMEQNGNNVPQSNVNVFDRYSKYDKRFKK